MVLLDLIAEELEGPSVREDYFYLGLAYALLGLFRNEPRGGLLVACDVHAQVGYLIVGEHLVAEVAHTVGLVLEAGEAALLHPGGNGERPQLNVVFAELHLVLAVDFLHDGAHGRQL